MVDILVDGIKVLWSDLVVHQSIDLFCTEVKFSANAVITRHSSVILKTDKGDIPLKMYSFDMQKGKAYYVCYPAAFYEILSRLYSPFVGECSTNDLFVKLGIKLSKSSIQTAIQHWVLHQMSWSEIITNIKAYTIPLNGDCPYLTLDLDGAVYIGDLSSNFKKQAKVISGDVISYKASTSYLSEFPGVVDCLFYTEEGLIKKTYDFLNGKYSSSRKSYQIFTSSDKISLTEAYLRNMFFAHYLNTEQFEIQAVQGIGVPVLGTKVSLEGSKVSFIIKESTMVYSPDSVPTIGLVLCSPPKEDVKIYE